MFATGITVSESSDMQVCSDLLGEKISVYSACSTFAVFLMLVRRLELGVVTSDKVEETSGFAGLGNGLLSGKGFRMLSANKCKGIEEDVMRMVKSHLSFVAAPTSKKTPSLRRPPVLRYIRSPIASLRSTLKSVPLPSVNEQQGWKYTYICKAC